MSDEEMDEEEMGDEEMDDEEWEEEPFLPSPPDPAVLERALKGLEGLRVPPVLMAARVKDPARFDRFFDQVLGRMLEEARASGDFASPDAMVQKVDVEGAPFRRIRMHVDAQLPMTEREEFEASLREKAGLRDDEVARVIKGVRALDVSAWIGFLGEYFVVSVGNDDGFLAECVRLHRGKGQGSVVDGPSRAGLRNVIASRLLLSSWTDMRPLRGAMDAHYPAVIRDLKEIMTTLGIPGADPIAALYESLYDPTVEPWIYEQVESHLWRDGGLRAESLGQLPPTHRGIVPRPLALGMVPADSLLWLGLAEGDLDAVPAIVGMAIDVVSAGPRSLVDNPDMDPGTKQRFAAMVASADRASDILEKRLARHMEKGGMLVVAPEASEGGPGVGFCAVMRSPAASEAPRDFADFFEAYGGIGGGRRRRPPVEQGSVRIEEERVDGVSWARPMASSDPDEARDLWMFHRGEELGLSLPRSLGMRMLQADATGWKPAAADRGAAWALQEGAHRGFWLDTPGVIRKVRETMDAPADRAGPPRPPGAPPGPELVRGVLDALAVFRTVTSSTVRKDGVDISRTWIVVEDLKPK